jgi:hypothetical protein
MDSDRRIPKRVRLVERCGGVQARAVRLPVVLVDISPAGACVGIDRAGSAAVDDLLDAWLHEHPMRLYLDEQERSTVALAMWARGPRVREQRLLFGLRFVQPIADFGTVVRELLRK